MPRSPRHSDDFRDERELLKFAAGPGKNGPRLRAPFLRLLPELARKMAEFPLCVYPFSQQDMACHQHTFMELVYVRKGQGIHIHGGQEYPIHRGDCFLVLPSDPHGYRNVADMTIVNILFLPSVLRQQKTELRRIPGFRGFFTLEPLHRAVTAFRYKLHLDPVQQEQVSTLIDRLDRELSARADGFRAMGAAVFVELVVALSRYFQAAPAAPVSFPVGAARVDAVSKAIAYIEERYNREISIDDLSSVAALSSSRLSHVFKESTGMSLRDYLLRIRLDKARELLPNRNLSVGEIAWACGFNDPNYFSRAFKKTSGMSPEAFRRSSR